MKGIVSHAPELLYRYDNSSLQYHTSLRARVIIVLICNLINKCFVLTKKNCFLLGPPKVLGGMSSTYCVNLQVLFTFTGTF